MSKSLTLWTVAGQAPLSWDSSVKNTGWVTMPSSRGSYQPRDQTHIFCISSGFFTTEPPRKVEVKVAQSCPTLCDPMDYTVHGILQARTLEWVAISFSRGSSQPRDRTQVSRIAGRFFTSWATREAQETEIHICRNYPIDINNSTQCSRCRIASTSSPKAIHTHLFNCQTLLQSLIPREARRGPAQGHFHDFYPRCLSSLRPKPPNWENHS